jgi:hypothetical protein
MEKRSKIGTLAIIIFAVGIISSMMVYLPGGDMRQWTVLGAQIVDDPTSGTNSGICGFYVFETGSTYTSNLTSGTDGYVAGGSAINATNLDINHTIGQDLIVWARFNDTDSGLDIQFAECNMTWVGNITADQAPDHIYVTGTGDFMFVNFVWDNANAGYTITRNQKNIAIDDIVIKGYK